MAAGGIYGHDKRCLTCFFGFFLVGWRGVEERCCCFASSSHAVRRKCPANRLAERAAVRVATGPRDQADRRLATVVVTHRNTCVWHIRGVFFVLFFKSAVALATLPFFIISYRILTEAN